MPGVETYKVDTMCFSKPMWCHRKKSQNRSLWPRWMKGFSSTSRVHLSLACGRFPTSQLTLTFHKSPPLQADPHESFSSGKTIGKDAGYILKYLLAQHLRGKVWLKIRDCALSYFTFSTFSMRTESAPRLLPTLLLPHNLSFGEKEFVYF